ncbi:MAG: hypothetical protein E3J46_12800 [Desulfobacteraceae bacterium]|nr:MAG: hypothetical protein E3J46_12800 [Desulfobacteraceae bacterium]
MESLDKTDKADKAIAAGSITQFCPKLTSTHIEVTAEIEVVTANLDGHEEFQSITESYLCIGGKCVMLDDLEIRSGEHVGWTLREMLAEEHREDLVKLVEERIKHEKEVSLMIHAHQNEMEA